MFIDYKVCTSHFSESFTFIHWLVMIPVFYYNSLLKIRKLKCREIKSHTQSHTARKQKAGIQNQKVGSESMLCYTILISEIPNLSGFWNVTLVCPHRSII